MAEPVEAGAKILKNTKIIVYVEEAIEDLIVVSFTYGGKLYQGVLLDANKKSVPPLLASPEKNSDVNDANGDRLFAVSQRHTYMQTGVENESPNNQLSNQLINNLRRPFKTFKNNSNSRPMRLRPRQVLCSKCRSICNENSENVQIQNSNSNFTSTLVNSKPQSVPRLTAAEKKEKYRLKPRTETIASMPSSSPANISPNAHLPYSSESCRMVLRKRRSIEIDKMDKMDKMDKNYYESDKRKNVRKERDDLNVNLDLKPIFLNKTSPVIKISFGPHGQGTVLKIPARSSELESEEVKVNEESGGGDILSHNCDLNPQQQQRDESCAKAAKKALKKAKKEARKSVSVSVNSNHKNRHHKHKFKHKRRHRDVILLTENNNNNNNNNNHTSIEEENVTSPPIRPNLNPHEIFEWNDDDEQDVDAVSSKNSPENSLGECQLDSNANSNCNSDQESSSSGRDKSKSQKNYKNVEKEEEKQLKPLMMRISSHNVDACAVANGRTMAIGDIVWGKIHGFPWWPGKVLSITISQRDNGVLITQQAHVAWFGSSTTSYMPCSQLVPFLEYFKTRYNKKKRGPYKEAIKQATLAAQQVLREMQTVNVINSPQT